MTSVDHDTVEGHAALETGSPDHLSETHRMIQETARQFSQSVLAPRAAQLDREAHRALLTDNLRQLAELGFMGLTIDEQYGGTHADAVAFSLALTELGRGCASTAVTVSVTNMVAEVIQAVGSEAQKQQCLPPLCSGEWLAGSFCLSESGAGSDPASMTTRADRDGDHWVLNGCKQWITSAEYAGIFVVWAVTDPQADKGKGISCFLVPADTPGLIIGPAEDKMGQKASATNEVRFENCRIPADALLGQMHQGYKIAVTELAGGRIGIGSMALGIALAALDTARDYVKERVQFGRPLADKQGLQWMLAERYTEMEAARLLLLQAATLKAAGRPFGCEASMAKWMATEKGNRACYDALQLMGGNGYVRDFPLERYARDIRVTSIYEGTSEIQKLIIARHLLY